MPRVVSWGVQKFSFANDQRRALSLVELLVVLGVISVLVVVSIPLMSGMGQAQALTKATDQLQGQFALARQVAQTKNQNVELRFYLGPNDALLGSQVVASSENGQSQVPETPYTPLPEQVASLSRSSFSTLLTDAPIATTLARGDHWTSPAQDFAYVEFSANGSVNLPVKPAGHQSWTLTLVAQHEAEATSLPANFATFLLNSTTGLVKVVRPE